MTNQPINELQLLVCDCAQSSQIFADLKQLDIPLNLVERQQITPEFLQKQYPCILVASTQVLNCIKPMILAEHGLNLPILCLQETGELDAALLELPSLLIIPLPCPQDSLVEKLNIALSFLGGAAPAAKVNFPLSYQIKTLHEAQETAQDIVSKLPGHSRIYLGLLELLINAIEHGNLEISFAEKSQLLANDQWLAELHKRLTIEPYASRVVTVTVADEPGFYRLEVIDQGQGFDWVALDSLPLGQEQHQHGRGILIAKMISFDKVDYIGLGNHVICKIRK